MSRVTYRYHSLEDFLISTPLSVDGVFDDGWGAAVPVKGREIEAAILFADISSFSSRTLNLSPTETLAFVNTFFAWITAEALRVGPAIVDKYIGDEIMVIFSPAFGSQDAFADAVLTARRMGENDFLDFCPHMGIAAGVVTAGFVGTPVKYNCSVFGAPVALAARCAGLHSGQAASSSIVFPAALAGDRPLADFFPSAPGRPSPWKVLPPRTAKPKNVGEIEVVEVINVTSHYIMSDDGPSSVEDIIRENLKALQEAGRYTPLGTGHKRVEKED
jgi:class 3 adenylate cyclase